MSKEWIVIIIDNDKIIPPKKYSCLKSLKTKEDAINTAKTNYETTYSNLNYESYTFEH